MDDTDGGKKKWTAVSKDEHWPSEEETIASLQTPLDTLAVRKIVTDPVALSELLDAVIDVLRANQAGSRETALAITKLQEARYWLGEWSNNAAG